MKFSRERVFHLAARLTEELLACEGVVALRASDDVRAEMIRTLSDETRVEETIDAEVRKILASYARPAPEGSPEWEVLYQKTREEVYRRRFRLP
ncbi:MAG: DUF507 family protein [Candidatus Rokuibacteriota bacterium]